jgi:hypothetical protein
MSPYSHTPFQTRFVPRFFVKDAVIGESLLGFDYRFKRIVLNLDEFSGIVGKARGFRDYGGNRFTLVNGFTHGHGKVANFLRMVRADFDEGLRLRSDFFADNCTNYAGERLGSGGVDANDARMCIRRAHKTEVKHFAKLDVVGELAPAAQQTVFFFAGKRGAYPGSVAVLFSFGHAFFGSVSFSHDV